MSETKSDFHDLLDRKRNREAIEDKGAQRDEIERKMAEFKARGGQVEKVGLLDRDLKVHPYNNKRKKK